MTLWVVLWAVITVLDVISDIASISDCTVCRRVYSLPVAAQVPLISVFLLVTCFNDPGFEIFVWRDVAFCNARSWLIYTN